MGQCNLTQDAKNLMNKSIIHRLLKQEAQRILEKQVEIWEVLSMPDGRIIATTDIEEATRLEAQGGSWDLLICVKGVNK